MACGGRIRKPAKMELPVRRAGVIHRNKDDVRRPHGPGAIHRPEPGRQRMSFLNCFLFGLKVK